MSYTDAVQGKPAGQKKSGSALHKKEMTGRQKAAVFLVLMGTEVAAEIFKHLREDEIEALTFEIARVENVDSSDKEMVLAEFKDLMMAQNFITTGGIDYARELLDKSLGAQKAADVINRLTNSLQIRPFDFIRRTDPAHLMNFILQEHPQTIALILAYLEPQKAAVIFHRIGNRDRILPKALDKLHFFQIAGILSAGQKQRGICLAGIRVVRIQLQPAPVFRQRPHSHMMAGKRVRARKSVLCPVRPRGVFQRKRPQHNIFCKKTENLVLRGRNKPCTRRSDRLAVTLQFGKRQRFLVPGGRITAVQLNHPVSGFVHFPEAVSIIQHGRPGIQRFRIFRFHRQG